MIPPQLPMNCFKNTQFLQRFQKHIIFPIILAWYPARVGANSAGTRPKTRHPVSPNTCSHAAYNTTSQIRPRHSRPSKYRLSNGFVASVSFSARWAFHAHVDNTRAFTTFSKEIRRASIGSSPSQQPHNRLQNYISSIPCLLLSLVAPEPKPDPLIQIPHLPLTFGAPLPPHNAVVAALDVTLALPASQLKRDFCLVFISASVIVELWWCSYFGLRVAISLLANVQMGS